MEKSIAPLDSILGPNNLKCEAIRNVIRDNQSSEGDIHQDFVTGSRTAITDKINHGLAELRLDPLQDPSMPQRPVSQDQPFLLAS